MDGVLADIRRHPVKGFTPERLARVALTPGSGLPFDRVYTVEDGPSGFDPEAPAHISKLRFTVLAKIPAVAKLRTHFDGDTHVFAAEADGHMPIAAPLREEHGRAALAEWLTDFFGDAVRGPLRVLPAPGAHRFFDDQQGDISLINLASVRDLASRIGRPVDPLRFRANLYVDGWPAWAEFDTQGVTIGDVQAKAVKPIRRCVATHVDPARGVIDIDIVPSLRKFYGHFNCGVYLNVTRGGDIGVGDCVIAKST
jgi:uncharacterized protein YcbX